jgi:hypothetical protein
MTEDSTTTTEEKIEEVVQFNSEVQDGTNGSQQSSPIEEVFGAGKPPPKGVKYRVEYRHEESEKVVHSIHTNRLDFEAVDAHGEIFDVVTTFLTPEEEFRSSKEPEGGARIAPLVTDTRRKIDMHIHSSSIIHALRSVVKYYPDQNLMGETVVIPAPYAILVHHEKELNDYKERCHPSLQTEPICPKEKNAYEEINVLQEFLKQTIMPDVELERERNKKGLETFDMIWLSRRPGKTFKFRPSNDTSSWVVGVVDYVKGGTIGFGGTAWSFGYWCLDYNGNFLGTFKKVFTIPRFEGEQNVNRVSIIEDFAFEEPLHESVKELVQQGEKFFKLLSKQCQKYKGTTVDFPHQQVSRFVIS